MPSVTAIFTRTVRKAVRRADKGHLKGDMCVPPREVWAIVCSLPPWQSINGVAWLTAPEHSRLTDLREILKRRLTEGRAC